MDQFKKYLRDHRNELDVEIPPPAPSWSSKPVKQLTIMRATKWIAAASIFLLVSSLVYWIVRDRDNNKSAYSKLVKDDTTAIQVHDSLKKNHTAISDTPVESDSVEIAFEEPQPQKKVLAKRPASTSKNKSKPKPSPLQSLETNYATIINYQLKRVERTPIYAESPDYFHVFKKQWYDLEKDEEKIKADIDMLGLNDIVVDQFITLYQNKIELLKQLQSQIDKMNLRARNHPGFHSQTPTYLKM